jgi:hypothetical protein
MKTNFDGIKKTAEQNFRDEIETTTTTDWLGIASIVIVLVASLIIVNELLGNPLLDYLTR